jgi:hypothetical protein
VTHSLLILDEEDKQRKKKGKETNKKRKFVSTDSEQRVLHFKVCSLCTKDNKVSNALGREFSTY